MVTEGLKCVRYCFAEYMKNGPKEKWVAFGVGCQLPDGVEFFFPAWRSRRRLPAALLEQLTQEHIPQIPMIMTESSLLRWSEICERILEKGETIHPNQLLVDRRFQHTGKLP